MKKLLSAVAVLIILSGCTAISTPQSVETDRNFTAKATITQNSAAYTADFEINENGCSVAFLLPEEIAGLKISFDGDSYTYQLGDLEFTSPPKNEVQQFLPLIYSALNDRSGTTTQEETHFSVQGRCEYGAYYININKETLLPTFLEIEGADLTVHFEQAKTNEPNTK